MSNFDLFLIFAAICIIGIVTLVYLYLILKVLSEIRNLLEKELEDYSDECEFEEAEGDYDDNPFYGIDDDNDPADWWKKQKNEEQSK